MNNIDKINKKLNSKSTIDEFVNELDILFSCNSGYCCLFCKYLKNSIACDNSDCCFEEIYDTLNGNYLIDINACVNFFDCLFDKNKSVYDFVKKYYKKHNILDKF